MRGFHVGACPEAVASDTSEMSKIEVELAGIAENFMRCDVVGAFERSSARDPCFPIRHPQSPRWRASLIRNGNLVEIYVGLIDDKTVT